MAKKICLQKHHICYDPEITVRILKGEHMVITLINRHTKNVSTGFILCLEKWIEEHRYLAVDYGTE